MRWKGLAVAALGASMVCAPVVAQSAPLPTLGSLQGAVFVDQGDGFRAASSSTVLRSGDRVMAGRGGVARLAYADGCDVQVTSRTLATIGATSPCAGGSGVHVTKAEYTDTAPAGGADTGGISTVGWVIGGLAVIGIVAVIVSVATDNGGSNSP
jgi:hypothetical protein